MVSYSGYDFGYFVKLLTAESLPTTEDKFFTLLRIWFPTVYDLKFLMRATKVLKGGLQEVADELGVGRHVCYAMSRSAQPDFLYLGCADRLISSGWVRLASDSFHLFQNARVILQ